MFRGSASDHVLDPSQILRVGTIVAVDLGAGTCTVEVGDAEDESVETADIKWGTLRAGKTRIWSPPSEREQVLLFCPAGDISQAIPLGALFSDEHPANGDSTRELIEFEDGAVFAYDPAENHWDVTLPPGATTRIESDGGVEIKGDVRIEGALTVEDTITGEADLKIEGQGTVEGDLTADGISVSRHTHSGVTTGAGSTGLPE